jgi:DNA-binding response OmpR family regulator
LGVATVTLVGEDELGRAPGFLRLGAVVVIAPDPEALAAWERERWAEATEGPPAPGDELASVRELRVDHRAHRIRWGTAALPLTELEYRVVGALLSEPGRARSYRELREAAWGPVPDLGDDAYVVRSAIRRVRRKFRAAGVTAEIEPVRGFGLRLADRQAPAGTAVRLARAGG